MSHFVVGDDARGNVISDLDGVVYRGESGIPDAGDALHRIESAGYRLLFATNNSSRLAEAVAAKIQRLTGYSADETQVVTSGLATATALKNDHEVAFVVGGEGLRRPLEDVGIRVTDDWREADVTVIGFDRSATYDKLRDATLAVQNGARFVASNVDPSFPALDGVWPGAGALAAVVQTATGVAPDAMGKPFLPMRSLIRARLVRGPVFVLGDRPDTDLTMAHEEGWTSVLVETGVTAPGDVVEPKPDVVLPSIADVPAYLGLG
jgi:4-nitrophenyl phosphatase